MGDKDFQISTLAKILVRLMPPVRAVAPTWAEKLYEQGVRVHPELAGSDNPKLPAPTQFTPEVRAAEMDRAWATLREMGERFPSLALLVTKIQNATTPEGRAAALLEMRAAISPEMIADLEQKIEQVGRDSTQ